MKNMMPQSKVGQAEKLALWLIIGVAGAILILIFIIYMFGGFSNLYQKLVHIRAPV